MSNRWKVTRAGFPTWCPGEHWWEVQELGDDGYWYADPDGMFSHFAPALTYADRMARTIRVTLPRTIGTIKEISNNTYISERAPTSPYGADILATNPQGTVGISITRDELEPLALTLLALARKGDSGGA